MTCDIGLIGLGTMGAALALNIAEKGFRVAVWNRTGAVTEEFHTKAGELAEQIVPAKTLEELVAALEPPRAILLMVPAGDPVDQQIAALKPLLDAQDLLIDAGNANFHDTNRRVKELSLPFMGIGVSGGEQGARHGPSIMGGGRKEYWDRVSLILTTIAAKYNGTPCATWMGDAGAGHFVKAVHNGIEYADMQMIAEVYGIMRDGMGMHADEIGAVFEKWNAGPLESYLIDISGKVARAEDPRTGNPLLDVIVDAAGQKGTGRWTVIEAQHLAAAVPAIEAAVVARNLSARRSLRAAGEYLFGAVEPPSDDGSISLEKLEHALIVGKILCYAQGFDMISAASEAFDWALPLPDIARVWREGCIIRSAMLNDMADALAEEPDRNLAFAPFFADLIKRYHTDLRQIVSGAALQGFSAPALGSGLSYFDMLRTARGTANMIQAQRDYFGLHGFVRLDTGEIDQHGPWAQQ